MLSIHSGIMKRVIPIPQNATLVFDVTLTAVQ
jgi:FKBP-type peptidyl-prolyl cis-trans isomerase